MSPVTKILMVGVAVQPVLHLPVTAQAPVKSVAQAELEESEVGLARYLDCVVSDDERRAMVFRYLRIDAAAPEAVAVTVKLSSSDCLQDAIPKSVKPTGSERSDRAGRFGAGSIDVYTMRMPPAAFRNALYHAIYRYEFGDTGPGPITDKPPILVSDEWDEVPDPLPDGWRVRRAIGDCVARGHPEASHRYVVSTPWSDTESAEIEEIAQALAECLPEGQTVALGREDLRGLIGEALYKLAVAPEASFAPTQNKVN